jgi:hypothetical protein
MSFEAPRTSTTTAAPRSSTTAAAARTSSTSSTTTTTQNKRAKVVAAHAVLGRQLTGPLAAVGAPEGKRSLLRHFGEIIGYVPGDVVGRFPKDGQQIDDFFATIGRNYEENMRAHGVSRSQVVPPIARALMVEQDRAGQRVAPFSGALEAADIYVLQGSRDETDGIRLVCVRHDAGSAADRQTLSEKSSELQLVPVRSMAVVEPASLLAERRRVAVASDNDNAAGR